MKDCVLLVSMADVHDYVGNLWKTPAFRDSHKQKGGFIHKVVDQFAKMPRLFCETTNDHLERAHFSTWWGSMMHRHDYPNPVVSDLYYLHEIYHAATMPYVPDIGRVAFDGKMQRNELEASVASEIQVYFEIPGLRADSFPHPIYADRFLRDPYMQSLWAHDREVAIETLRIRRCDVMMSKPEHLMDVTELWIRRFAEQNEAYSVTWSDQYNDVERHMAQVRSMAMAGDRAAAIRFHRDWLEAEAAKDTKDNIPFRLQAELFTGFYWANKAKHQAAMQAEAQRVKTKAQEGRANPGPRESAAET